MVVALYGDTCVGKTTVAKLLAQDLGCGVRHCGELIKERSRALNCTPDDLPVRDHLAIDDESRQIARNATSDVIIEGRFLNFVLYDVTEAVLIRLACSDAERERRYCLHLKEGSIATSDAKDSQLRGTLYGTEPKRKPDLQIETSCFSAKDIAARILVWLRGN
jgi:cytidylate kinase